MRILQFCIMAATLATSAVLAMFTALPASAQDAPRTTNLGISGPSMTAVGGPGAHFLKYNSNPNAGSAVRDGLIPPIGPLIDAQIRDAVICVGHDGRYYMTGSCGDDIWKQNDGVELWVSSDLRSWDYMGLVWSFDRDGTWQREWRHHHRPVRALWAPEIHYVKGNYFITLSMPPGDRGLLKSSTGRPEGPYVNALADDGKWDGDIDASLFEDTDGTVYVIWGGGWIARMKDDMSGMAEEPRQPILLNPDTVASHHARTCPKRCGATDIGHERRIAVQAQRSVLPHRRRPVRGPLQQHGRRFGKHSSVTACATRQCRAAVAPDISATTAATGGACSSATTTRHHSARCQP